MSIPYAPQFGGFTPLTAKTTGLNIPKFGDFMNQGYQPTSSNYNVSVPSFSDGLGGQLSQGLQQSNVIGSGVAMPSWSSKANDWLSGNKDLVNGGLNAAVGLMGAFNAWNTNKLAKQQFAFQKDAYNADYANQVKQTNANLSDRAYARYAADPTHYQDPAAYMAKWGVK
jgi:hypothetical protein